MDKVMGHFFKQALGMEPFEEHASKGQSVYAQLVHYRFEEVITKAFPLLTRAVDKDLLDRAIRAFMHHAPQSPYIWEVPRHFWAFEREHRILNLPFVDDLMWYEWVEVELMMATYAPHKNETFSWEKAWGVDESVRMRHLNYRVFESAFEKASPCYLIAWFNRNTGIACYKEVSEVIYRLLENLTCKPFNEVLQSLSQEADTTESELKLYLTSALEALCEEGIIVSKGETP